MKNFKSKVKMFVLSHLKQVISLFLVLVVLIVFFIGCGVGALITEARDEYVSHNTITVTPSGLGGTCSLLLPYENIALPLNQSNVSFDTSGRYIENQHYYDTLNTWSNYAVSSDYVAHLPFRLSLPASYADTVINGDFTFQFYIYDPGLTNSNGPWKVFDWRGINILDNQITDVYLNDHTETFHLFLEDQGSDSLYYDLLNTSVSGNNYYYTLNVHFNNYRVGKSSSSGWLSSHAIDIPLACSFVFDGTWYWTQHIELDVGQLPNGTPDYRDYVYPYLSTVDFLFNPLPVVSGNGTGRITGARFLIDNDYYTVLNAINNSTFSTQHLPNLYNLLNAMKSNFDQFADIDFPAFSQSILGGIGSISSDLDNFETVFSNIYSQLVSLNATAGTLSQFMQNIYNVLNSIKVKHANILGIPVEDNSNSITGLLYSIATAFTGDYLLEGTLDADSLQAKVYDRWVRIITDGTEEGVVNALHRYFDSEDFQGQLGSLSEIKAFTDDQWNKLDHLNDQYFNDNSNWENYGIEDGIYFWTSTLSKFWDSMGVFRYVIITVLISGIIVIILGKIRIH